ncbi:MAG: KH domain-containing protein [Cyanobacteria bacterium P01_H01_bin.58]
MVAKPNYEGLVKFLMTPFLEFPDHLKMDVEHLGAHNKMWLRVAFSPEDRGRMFGRGGRNIQAIRTVLQATAALQEQRAALDVYGESTGSDRGGSSGNGGGGDRRRRGNRGPSNRRPSH